jgi:hypothetical protein
VHPAGSQLFVLMSVFGAPHRCGCWAVNACVAFWHDSVRSNKVTVLCLHANGVMRGAFEAATCTKCRVDTCRELQDTSCAGTSVGPDQSSMI